MPIVENLPDLSHWKTVQEFSISQAALLLAGIDPFDFDEGKELDQVRHATMNVEASMGNEFGDFNGYQARYINTDPVLFRANGGKLEWA